MCPIDKGKVKVTPVPTEIPFKLLTAKNMSNIAASVPCQDILTKCTKMVSSTCSFRMSSRLLARFSRLPFSEGAGGLSAENMLAKE
jgi:hypothetical protein